MFFYLIHAELQQQFHTLADRMNGICALTAGFQPSDIVEEINFVKVCGDARGKNMGLCTLITGGGWEDLFDDSGIAVDEGCAPSTHQGLESTANQIIDTAISHIDGQSANALKTVYNENDASFAAGLTQRL